MIKGAKAFTVLELMAVMLTLAILVSISVVGYQGYRDRAAMLVDETNQKVLAAAVKLYAYDNNALPGSISQLRPVDLDRAYALVSSGRRPYTVLAYLAEKMGGDVAEAVPLPRRYYQNNDNITHCPSDNDGNGISYQINSFFAKSPNNTLASLLAPANQGLVLIFESDTKGDNGADPDKAAVYRHGGGNVMVRTTVSGIPQRDDKRKSGSGGEGGEKGGGGNAPPTG